MFSERETSSAVFNEQEASSEGVAPSQRKVEPPRESDVLRAEDRVRSRGAPVDHRRLVEAFDLALCAAAA